MERRWFLLLEPLLVLFSWEVGSNDNCDGRDDSDVEVMDSDQVVTAEGGSDGDD